MLCAVILSGCGTTHSTVKSGQKPVETQDEVTRALGAVGEAVSGQNISREDIKNLSRQVSQDEKASTAVKAVTGALSGQDMTVKYCPEDGKRYSTELEFCPGTEIRLLPVE